MLKMRLFISHNYTDDDFVTQLARDLQETGLNTWIDHHDAPDDAAAPNAVARDAAILAALHECEMLVAVLSPDALESQDVQDEWGYFVDHGKSIVVVIAEVCTVPVELQAYSCVDFTQGASFMQLARALGVSMPTQPLDGHVLSQFEAGLKRLDQIVPDEKE